MSSRERTSIVALLAGCAGCCAYGDICSLRFPAARNDRRLQVATTSSRVASEAQ
jgi:hypothetical protein